MAVDCRDSESDVDYLHRREDASSDVCRVDRIDLSVNLPSFDLETPPPPYTPPKLMIPAYEEASPPYESMILSQLPETGQNAGHCGWFTSESIWNSYRAYQLHYVMELWN